MFPGCDNERVRGSGALFIKRWFCIRVTAVLALSLSGYISTASAYSCAPDHIDETAAVEYVYDGDTIRLKDGRKLRLIGVNTPELGRDGAAPEAFAEAARDGLRTLLAPGESVGLRFDTERHDKYGRTLAHVFLHSGVSITAWLLEHGLGTTFPVPPNLWNLECYRFVEQDAEDQHRGIWALEKYQSTGVDALPPDASGYHIVHGRVNRAVLDKRFLRLELADKLVIRIDSDDLSFFGTEFSAKGPVFWSGKNLEVRGWLTRRGDRFYMRIRHPASLRILN